MRACSCAGRATSQKSAMLAPKKSSNVAKPQAAPTSARITPASAGPTIFEAFIEKLSSTVDWTSDARPTMSTISARRAGQSTAQLSPSSRAPSQIQG